MNSSSQFAYHFLQPSGTLRDGQPAIVGHVYKVEPPLELCERGLHFSFRAIDALQYSNSNILTIVRIGGVVIVQGDKGCCSERTIVAGPVDVESTLRAFSRWCALQVVHLWDCPPIVKQYLETGDESIRAAAWDAAWDAARDAKFEEFNDHLEAMLLAQLQFTVPA